MAADIRIKKVNESTIQLDSTNQICGELSNHFSSFAENYKFMPKFRAGTWDGKIRMFDFRTNTMPIGLLTRLHEFCAKGGYTYQQNFPMPEKRCLVEFKNFVASLGIPEKFEVRDYQLQAAYDAISLQRLNISSSTSSGKSLILYLIIRWMIKEELKTLLIVPSTQLVEQMFNDFYEYGWHEVEDKVCMIYSGKQRLINRPVILSTWQSLYTDKDKEELAKFKCILVDEAHGNSSNSKALTGMARNAINAEYRIGLSGSFPNEGTADWLSTVGAMGQIKVYSTYKTLQEAGYIADFKIVATVLQYPKEIRYQAYRITQDICSDDDKMKETKRYNVESEFVNNLPSRNEFILKLVTSLKGNSLVLFKNKEAHGIPLFNLIKNRLSDKTVLYIDGDIDTAKRVEIQHRIEKEDNIVLVASLGTLSTGISIKNLHSLVLASGTKSKVKTIQSIGRLLRLNPNKGLVRIFDIVDDLSFRDTKQKIYYHNFSKKHFKERMKIYTDNKFTVDNLEYTIRN